MKHKYFLTKKKWYYEDIVDYQYLVISIFFNDKLVNFDVSAVTPDAMHLTIDADYTAAYIVENNMSVGFIQELWFDNLTFDQEIEVACEITLSDYVDVSFPDIVVANYSLSNIAFEIGNAIDYFIDITLFTKFINNAIIEVGEIFPITNIVCSIGELNVEQEIEMELETIHRMYADIDEPIYVNTDITVGPPVIDFLRVESIECNVTIPDYQISASFDCQPILRFSGLAGLEFNQLQGLEFEDLLLKTW